MAGSYDDAGGTGLGGFIDDKGTYTTISVPNATYTAVGGINNSGELSGHYVDKLGTHGFIYDKGTYITLNALGSGYTVANGINDRGVVVGVYYDNTGTHSFVEDKGTYTTVAPLSSNSADAIDINNSGQIVGLYSSGVGERGFIDNHGNYTTIAPPGTGYDASANGINDQGIVVGWYDDINNNRHGFIYENGNYTTVDAPGSTSTVLTGINNSGEIVGYYNTNEGSYGFVASDTGKPAASASLTLSDIMSSPPSQISMADLVPAVPAMGGQSGPSAHWSGLSDKLPVTALGTPAFPGGHETAMPFIGSSNG